MAMYGQPEVPYKVRDNQFAASSDAVSPLSHNVRWFAHVLGCLCNHKVALIDAVLCRLSLLSWLLTM